MIEIKHLRKVFDDDTIPLKDIDVTINDGDVISIIGPSGTGKSTLLRCINMLTEPTSGSIIVDGQDITGKGCDLNEIRKKMGMVFQSFNLFGHLTIIENIMNPQITLLGRSRKARRHQPYFHRQRCVRRSPRARLRGICHRGRKEPYGAEALVHIDRRRSQDNVGDIKIWRQGFTNISWQWYG